MAEPMETCSSDAGGFTGSSLFDSPHCLIETNKEGRLVVNANVLSQVAALDKELVVVAIAGLYRTGKSYLLNRLAGKNSGFALGSTIESKTKGIWIWVRNHPQYAEKYLILLDTEGLGDANKGDETHDTWIFSLATLLSSVLVYNALGAINEQALAKLNFITEMSKHIRTRSTSDGRKEDENFDWYFPHFIYVIRDFSLDLEIEGREVTEDQYLEHCLNLKPGKDDRAERYNLPRECIRRYFKNRKCFKFDRPGGRSTLKQLEKLPDSDLSRDFVEETHRFCNHIYKNGVVKKLQSGQPLNGRMWSVIVNAYVDAKRKGSVPCIENAVVAMAKIENTRAKEEGVQLYRKLMMENVTLPTPDDKTLSDIHSKALSTAIKYFVDKAIYDNDHEFQKQMNQMIAQRYEQFIADNKQASRNKCKEVLGKLEKVMIKKVQEGGYSKPGRYWENSTDLHAIQKQYRGQQGLGVQANDVLLEYLLEKMQEGEGIMAADKEITQRERKADGGFTGSSLFDSPHCLIETNKEGRLVVNANVLSQVAALDKELVVVAIAGLYRTGKSYLLNRLAGKNSGFALGSTIESKTKGIWIWVRNHPQYAEKYLILLDTEGLGDANKGDETHDTWIFSLATLLSSVLVYNALGAINEEALAKLKGFIQSLHFSFITEMSKHIRTRSTSDGRKEDENFDWYFPHFIYVIRDFSLELEIDGREVTEDQYLEHCLNLKPGKDDRAERYNLPRKCIRRFFKNRKCFTFNRPGGRSTLKQLEKLPDSDLPRDFVEETHRFCNHIYKNGVVKKLQSGQPLNGRMWSVIVNAYVDAIRKGSVPCIENAVVAMAKIENTRAKEEGVQLYRKLMMENVTLPTPDDKTLSDIHSKALSTAIKYFVDKAIYDNDHEFQKQMNQMIAQTYEQFIADNKQASRNKSKEVLGKLEKVMIKKVQEGGYSKPGGYREYSTDLHAIQKQYRGQEGLGVQANDVLLEYLQEKMREGEGIMAADKEITQRERKADEERQKALAAERAKEMAERERELAQQHQREQEEAYKVPAHVTS